MSNSTQALFARGVELEESQPEQAAHAYKALLEVEPDHTAAHINLGTIYYNRRELDRAEHHYRMAVILDPNYALAMFDLANVLDEFERDEEAIGLYKRAIHIAPTYADAHYNLALAYEKQEEHSNALRHWRAYVKLDSSSPWSNHAKMQIQRSVKRTGLTLVHSNGPAKRTGSAALQLVTN